MKTAEEFVNKSNQILMEKKQQFMNDINPKKTNQTEPSSLGKNSSVNQKNKAKEKRKYGIDNDDQGKELSSLKSEYQGLYNDKNTEDEKMKALQQEIKRREDRFTKREQEYRLFEEELDKNIRARMGIDIQGLPKDERDERLKQSSTEIKTLHKQIIDTIYGIHSKTRKILEEQEKDIGRAYNSKLAEIKKDMDDEAKAVSRYALNQN
jgi:hypothetical protein